MKSICVKALIVAGVVSLWGCSKGGPFDILENSLETPEDLSMTSKDGGVDGSTGTMTIPVDFTALSNAGCSGHPPKSQDAMGNFTTPDQTMFTKAEFDTAALQVKTAGCTYRSNPLTIPFAAKQIVLKAQTNHDFDYLCPASPCTKLRHSWGTLKVVDMNGSKVMEMAPSFHQKVVSPYAINLLIPPLAKDMQVQVEVTMDYVVGNITNSDNDGRPSLGWTFQGMKLELTP